MLMLRFVESMTQTQIAERVGISQMHVSRILAKSLARLRDQLWGSAIDGPQVAADSLGPSQARTARRWP